MPMWSTGTSSSVSSSGSWPIRAWPICTRTTPGGAVTRLASTEREERRNLAGSASAVQAQRIHQEAGELRPLARFLVLEVHVNLSAAGCPVADDVRPARDIGGRIPFVAQPEIRVVRRNLDRRRHGLAISDAEREVPR